MYSVLLVVAFVAAVVAVVALVAVVVVALVATGWALILLAERFHRLQLFKVVVYKRLACC